MSTLNYTELAKLLFITVEKAGKTIMEYYDSSEMNVQLKRDDSPVTDADLASNEVITKALSKTGIPILSEESDIQDFHIRKNWKRYWLIWHHNHSFLPIDVLLLDCNWSMSIVHQR